MSLNFLGGHSVVEQNVLEEFGTTKDVTLIKSSDTRWCQEARQFYRD